MFEFIFGFTMAVFIGFSYPFVMTAILWPMNEQPVSRGQKLTAIVVSLLYLFLAWFNFN